MILAVSIWLSQEQLGKSLLGFNVKANKQLTGGCSTPSSLSRLPLEPRDSGF